MAALQEQASGRTLNKGCTPIGMRFAYPAGIIADGAGSRHYDTNEGAGGFLRAAFDDVHSVAHRQLAADQLVRHVAYMRRGGHGAGLMDALGLSPFASQIRVERLDDAAPTTRPGGSGTPQGTNGTSLQYKVAAAESRVSYLGGAVVCD
jgi:hypothetical protein